MDSPGNQRTAQESQAEGRVDSSGIRGDRLELSGRNAIAAAFYDGPGWRRFRIWERLFLSLQFGERHARTQILKHLPRPSRARVLEVGIGDADNLRYLPDEWEVHGIDLARTRLAKAVEVHPTLTGRLTWAQAESLPFDDHEFDHCFTVGGFNYFSDHRCALQEMSRVTKPGGTIVVADEDPRLHRFGIGHLIGKPAIDLAWLRWLGLDREFASMVIDLPIDPIAAIQEIWPNARRHSIWLGLGYCFVHQA